MNVLPGQGPIPHAEYGVAITAGHSILLNDQVRLSMRIIMHLTPAQGHGETSSAGPESTQGGMATALCVTQGAVSKILARLIAVGVVRDESHHVRGKLRRMRVYFLTYKGELLARDVIRRFGEASTLGRPVNSPARKDPT